VTPLSVAAYLSLPAPASACRAESDIVKSSGESGSSASRMYVTESDAILLKNPAVACPPNSDREYDWSVYSKSTFTRDAEVMSRRDVNVISPSE